MRTYEQRRDWILNWLQQQDHFGVSAVDSPFIDAFIDATKCSYVFKNWGAHGCPAAMRTIKRMFQEGLLVRKRVGLSTNWQPGFPKWVYCYDLPEQDDGN